MGFLETVKSILGFSPVSIDDLNDAVAPEEPRLSSVLPKATTARDRIEVIPEYEKAQALIKARAPLTFVTGGAGTGKSTLIRYLQNVLSLNIAIAAPTGVAALNAGGVTAHSLFQLPPRVIRPEDIKEARDRRLCEKLDLLILDEVSMARCDLIDGIDGFLRLNCGSRQPFGGVQVLMIGDMFQLPPVVTHDERPVLRQLEYRTEYFFSAHAMEGASIAPIILSRVFRQSDMEFIALLNNLREGSNVSSSLKMINARCVQAARAGELVLTSTNKAAERRNEIALERLKTPIRCYSGKFEGEFRLNGPRLPSPQKLYLKVGAQVMFTKNDPDKQWVNGSIGTVVKLTRKFIEVRLSDGLRAGMKVKVEPVTWEQYKYVYDEERGKIVPVVTGTYTQFPLMLAWAVTIHKAQGKTLGKVLIDLGTGAFASGQVYVALSRVRSLDDIRLSRPIRPDEIRCDEYISRFYSELKLGMTQ